MLSVALRHDLGSFGLDVSFEAPPGITVLFGRSGSGKTTTVNAVAGLLRPREGRVSIGGEVLFDTASRVWQPAHRRSLGYIFQDARLFPHLTVQQNLLYGRWFAARHTRGVSLDRVVQMLGIGHLLMRRPGSLSGGEKQRVAIGRALLANPRLILADEPLASLDEERKAEILPYFERLRDEMEIPILYVSHSAAEVARLATTVVVLEEGRVARTGPAAEILGDPSVLPLGVRAAGAMLQAHVLAHHEDGLTELQTGSARLLVPRVARGEGAPVRIRIPAHEVLLARDEPAGLSALNVLRGTVRTMQPVEEGGILLSLDTAAGPILARITRRSAQALGLAEGANCHAIIKTVAIAPDIAPDSAGNGGG